LRIALQKQSASRFSAPASGPNRFALAGNERRSEAALRIRTRRAQVTEGIALLRAEVLDEQDRNDLIAQGGCSGNMNTAADYEEARRILKRSAVSEESG